MRSLSPAQRRKRAIGKAQFTVSGCPTRKDLLDRPSAVHRRDAMFCLAMAAEHRTRAVLMFENDPIAACRLRIAAVQALRSAQRTDALARSYGFSLPAGAL